MVVYCVMELTDPEHGCRSVESVWTTYERAEGRIYELVEKHIEELGQQNIGMRTGENIDLYTINSYRVNE